MDDKLRQICFFMFLKGFIVSWVDLLTLALVIAGVCRGRKRGMSEELLDLIKWLLTVVIAGRLYQPLGRVLAESTVFSLLACYVAVYCGLIIVIKLLFAVIQRTAGQKLVGSDVFGSGEYYLGMVAGAIRFACIFFVALAFLNARQFSAEEVAAEAKYQQENFGDIRFPTLNGLQTAVFQLSLTGKFVRQHLHPLLIKSTAPETKSLAGNDSVVRGRERRFDEVLEKK